MAWTRDTPEGNLKAPAKEETLLRKHCFPKCFLAQTSKKQQNNVLLPCCANEEIKRKTKIK